MVESISKILDRNQIIDRVFRLKSELIWIALGQGGVMIGGVLGIKVLTHVLDPHEFGRFALANTFVLLIGTNLFGPIGQGLMRFWSISGERNELVSFSKVSKKIIHRLSYWTISLGAGAMVILLFFKGPAWAILLFASIIGGVLSGWAGIRLYILMAARERKNVAIINTCASFAKPLTGILLIYIFNEDAIYALLGYVISLCVVVFAAENLFNKKVNKKVSEREGDNGQKNSEKRYSSHLGKELLSFVWPFYIWGIFGWMHQSCDRWALQSFHGADSVGAFFVVSQLAVYPLVAGTSFLSTLFIPIAYQKAGGLKSKKDFESANKIVLVMSALYFIGAVLLILVYSVFHTRLILMISSEQYAVYSGLLPGLTGAWALYYLGQMFSSFGLLANKPVLYMAPIITSGLLATVLTFVWSSIYGVAGVVWGLGVSGFVYAVWFLGIAFALTRKKQVPSA